jgi:glutathione peroxidase
LRLKNLIIFSVLSLLSVSAAAGPRIYDIPVKAIDGKSTNLGEHKGKLMLIVNTASQCGFTPQYAGLEALYQKFRERGFVVLAFPSNDFGGQEPGSETEIKKFCELKYKTTFPLYAKVGVKDSPHPLFAYLQGEAKAAVGWNFGKFLVSRRGEVLSYHPSKVKPADLEKAIEEELRK